MGTWEEVKNRRLFQIVVAYVGGGWLVLEGIGLLVEQGIVPEVAFGLALVAYITGIPASLILGWYHGEKGQQRMRLPEILLLTLVGIGGLGSGVYVFQGYLARDAVASAGDLDASLDARRIAVLSFEDRGEGERLQHIAHGFSEELREQLSRVRTLDVVSAAGAAQFRASDLPMDSLARVLDAGTLIRGTVEPEGGQGDRLRVSFRLIDGVSGTEFRRQSLAWPADSLVTAQTELAREVARLLREWLGEEIQLRAARRETSSSAAWALVQRADRIVEEARAAVDNGDAESARALYKNADSLLARAAETDPRWSEPPVQRAWIAYELAQPGLARSREEAGEWVNRGLEHAARALLEVEARSPEALEARGTLRYQQFRFHSIPGGMDRARLLELARQDLETAVDLRPDLASAYATLSSLYYHTDDFSAAVLAARQAYQNDYYLRSADDVLWRLFNATYDLEDYNGAERWCQEGRTRFSHDWRFVDCQLWLMTMPAAEPDVDRAWALYEEMENLIPATRPELLARARAVVGGVLGRAAAGAPEGVPERTALRDSADSVLRDARMSSDMDPERNWLWWEAVMRTLMGDHQQAIQLLERYAAANPGHFTEEAALHWWWEDLKGRPGFERIRALQSEGH